MTTVTLEEAQAHLAELVRSLPPGEDIRITDAGQTVATLTVASRSPTEPRRLGTLRGTVLSMDRFDEPLEEFEAMDG